MRVWPSAARTAMMLLVTLSAAACRDAAPTETLAGEPSAFLTSEAAPASSLIDLGTLGGSTSIAHDINAAGQVVGNSLTSGGSSHGFLWTAAGGMQDLGSMHPNQQIQANKINDSGTIVGTSGRAFSRSSAGTWLDLGVLPGMHSSTATGINNKGEIVGYSSTYLHHGLYRAFIYIPGTGMAPILPPNPTWNMQPYDINDSSQIVGSLGGSAFIMNYPDGPVRIIASGATAVAINNAGQVVGWQEQGMAAYPFVWDSVNGIRNPPRPSRVSYSQARDIDENGRIIGYGGGRWGGNFLWTPNGTGGYTRTRLPLSTRAIAAGVVVGSTYYGRAALLSPDPPTMPAVPQGLASRAVSSERVDLSWIDASNNESSFQVMRSTRNSDGTFSALQKIGSAGVNGTRYSDSTAVPGATHRYQVQACNEVGCAASNEVTVALPPEAPTGVAGRAVSAARVDVSWTDASTHEQTFRVRRSTRLPDGTFPPFQPLGAVAAGVTAFTDSTVSPGRTYRYVVLACSSSACSISRSALIDVPLRPAEPTGLSVTLVSERRIDLAWNDASTNESHFRVQRTMRRPDGTYAPYEWIAMLRAGASAYTDGTAQSGGVYHYRVAACNTSGCSVSPVSVGSAVPPGPAAPAGVVAQAVSSTRVDVRWTDASINETSFRIWRSTRRTDGTFTPFQRVGTVGTGVTSFTDNTVVRVSTYRYLVQACRSEACTSSASAVVTVPGS